jgi:hypothetical protein
MCRPPQSIWHYLFVCLAGIAFQISSAKAQQTINVPGNQPTIQAGINVAVNGDTVLVGPGTYKENINFQGKAITVTSSAGPQNTIIDGSAGPVVVQFVTGETRSSVLNGFTIENAGASQWPNENPDVFDYGIEVAGIAGSLSANSYANPTITNNIITHNYGYGIYVNFAGALISGNVVSYTSTQYDPRFDFGCDYDDGDGIFVGGTPSNPSVFTAISNNTIENNVGHCEGGGIGLYAAPASTIISNNIIASNQSLGFGGGLYEVNGSVSLNQNLIYNNVSGAAGGGVYLSMGSGENGATGPLNVFITNNTIYGNTIMLNPLIKDDWIDGSQVALPGFVSQVGFFNNLVIGNDTYSAISCWAAYQYLSGAPPVVVDSDVINAGGPAYGGWCTSPAGNGNISTDPKFNDPSHGDFHLQAGSPSIDTGFNAATGLLAIDLDGNPRIQDATGATAPIVDMGVYEAVGTPDSRFPSQTTLTAQPSTVFYGQAVSLSATAVDHSSSPIVQGTVNFMDDWSVIHQSSLNNSGTATTSTSFGLGPHWLIAAFGGNPTYQSSISATTEVVVNGFSTSTSISFSANPGKSGQPEILSATVALEPGNPVGTGTPVGSMAFVGSGNLLATVPLSASGVATYITSSLPSGTTYVQAIYQPTGGFLGSSSQNLPLVIATPPVATVAVSLNYQTIAGTEPLNVNIAIAGTTGNPTPTGSVTLTSGGYSSGLISLSGGNAAINVPSNSLADGNDMLTVKYSGDSVYGTATGTASVVVVTAPFLISGSPLSVLPGATSGNQSTISITPVGGFTGSVILTPVLTSSPADATNLPTFTFGTSGSVSITTTATATATLSITTTSPAGCQQAASVGSHNRTMLSLEFALACILFVTKPRRSRWCRRFSMMLLLVGLTGWLAACGGNSVQSGGGSCSVTGTTPGNYVITVTGASGSITANGSVSLIVQ